MGFIKGTTSIDLGDTPIENIFLDVFMPMANGTYVKVYLLAYKHACHTENALEVNNTTIARNLSISLEDVNAAWDFWEEKKIIKKHYLTDDEASTYTVEFINLKQLYIDNNYTHVSIEKNAYSAEAYSPTTKDLIEANQIPAIKNMFTEINRIISRPLVPNEKRQILEWFYDFNVDPPLIIKAFSYCKYNKNIKNIKYVAAVVRNWYDLGITSVEGLQEHLVKQGERYGIYERVYKALGFSSREPAEADMKIIDVWVDQYHFSLEVILKACENTSKTSNPNINYINGILSDWYKKGVKKVEDIDQLDKKPARQTVSTPTNKVKTKFHLSKSRFDEYTPEELKSLLLKNQKK